MVTVTVMNIRNFSKTPPDAGGGGGKARLRETRGRIKTAVEA